MNALLTSVREYYDEKLRQHGATPNGVDWNGEISQNKRFDALSQLIPRSAAESFSIDDYGCGYGAYLSYLKRCGYGRANYLGLDVSPDMVREAQNLHPGSAFAVGTTSSRVAEYAVASGIFNVALDVDRTAWEGYILETLDTIHTASTHGFAFNCLTSYSDADHMRPHLYYGDPGFFFDHCKRQYSRQVALLHDYGLYEFTIIVRKEV